MDGAQESPPRGLRGMWAHWRRGAHALGVVQTRGLMLLIYLAIVLPTGVVMRLATDPLHLRPPEGSNWTPVEQRERNLDAARQQY